MASDKHAYLIMAHGDAMHLENLVDALDDDRNDIFIHIDSKSDIANFNGIKSKKSGLSWIENRIDVRWGDPSQIHAEYTLFREAAKGKYARYHLISGADFPIKSQDEIHKFFEAHPDEEFIDFEDETQLVGELRKKMRLYNFFLPYLKHRNKGVAFAANFFRRVLLAFQMGIGVNRRFTIDTIKKGSQWASVTHAFVEELLRLENEIKHEYRLTHCCDEIYKQTIVWNCGFRNRISPLGNLRHIDFKRGSRQSPYTFREADFNELTSSKALFARKFSSTDSGKLVAKLKSEISK